MDNQNKASPAALTDERETFEKHFFGWDHSRQRAQIGNSQVYKNETLEGMWQAWQARAKLAPAPSALTDAQILEILKPHRASMLETYTRCFYEDEWRETRLAEASVLAFARALLAASPAAPAPSDSGPLINKGTKPVTAEDVRANRRNGESMWDTKARLEGAPSASPICTCPSGDGSLRHPCPSHPSASPAALTGDDHE